jgi:hypothetical protein
VPELPEFDDPEVITGAKGVAQNHYVRENFHRCIDLFSKMWHHHTEFLMLYHHHRSWAEDLTVPFTAQPRYVARVRDGLLADRPTEALRAERDRIAASYRDLLATEEERAAFDQMLGLCRVVFPYVEDHKFYCEHWFTTQFFSRIREFGGLAIAVGTGLGGSAAYDGLPVSRRPHLRVRGVDELLEMLGGSDGA